MASGKGISLFFKDCRYDSLMKITSTQWKGLMYVVPRSEISKMIGLEEVNRFGVYLLLSDTQIYAGEASDLKNRIKQHDKAKNWWERAVLITTTDDSFDQADINYLETSIISIAKNQSNLKCENKQTGNKKKLDEMKKAELDPFLEEALSIMKVLGVMKVNVKDAMEGKDDTISQLRHGVGAKSIAIDYLKDKGHPFQDGHVFNYSARQKETEKSKYKNECWVNPKPNRLDSDWYLILNDMKRRKLHILRIPHGTFHLETAEERGFKLRTDTGNLDMFVNLSTFTERKSGINLLKFKDASYDY